MISVLSLFLDFSKSSKQCDADTIHLSATMVAVQYMSPSEAESPEEVSEEVGEEGFRCFNSANLPHSKSSLEISV